AINQQFMKISQADYSAEIPLSAQESYAIFAMITLIVLAVALWSSSLPVAGFGAFVLAVVALIVQSTGRDKRIREANHRKDIDLEKLQYTLNATTAALQ